MRTLATLILKRFIRAYQLLLSPTLGGACRFQPTCSHYALQALDLHGPVAGSYLSVRRICRCNPFVQGGSDPVPPSFSFTFLVNRQGKS
jgi:putative membrane protein insertion efficiency factor